MARLWFQGALWLTLVSVTSLASAQDWFGRGLERDRVPDEAFASVVAFPKRLAQDPQWELFPSEIVTAWGKKEFGFDPMLLEQATLVLQVSESGLEAPPLWGLILHFDQMQGLAGGMIDRMPRQQLDGKTLYSGSGMGMPSFLVWDESTILAGDEALFESMAQASGRGKLASLMGRAKVRGEVVAFAELSDMRPMINTALEQIPFMPPPIARLKKLPDMLEGVEASVSVKDLSPTTSLYLHFQDEDQAADADEIIDDALDMGTDLLLGMMATNFDMEDPVQAAAMEYFQRLFGDARDQLKPKQQGSRLTIELKDETAMAPILVGMLLPAVQSTRSAARRVSSMNNSRQMMLAMHNYAAVHNRFPAQANYVNGKPMLSWRVHILPYIEQQALYEQFHLDEPWDSPHNRKLISQMPMVFMSPSVGDLGGKTVYLGVSGENSIFNRDGRRFQEIRDGLSNTIAILEVNPEAAVEWTRPMDYEVDPRQPFRGLGGVNPGVILGSMADGSVQAFSNSVDPETWKAMLTVDGGEVIGPNNR